MIRAAFVALALAASAPALACGGDQPCDKSHCKMKAQSEVDTAMAAVDAAEGTKVSFAVTGMSCGNCSDAVTAALKGVEGVNEAAVSHAEGVAKVAFDDKKTSIDALIETVNKIGKFKAEKTEQVES